MKKSIYIAVSVMLFSLFVTLLLFITKSGLYHDHFTTKSVDGKDEYYTFDEIECNANYSVVKVSIRSDHSNFPRMFVTKGMVMIARRRGCEHFALLKEWRDDKDVRFYNIGFTNNTSVDPAKYYGDNIKDNSPYITYETIRSYDNLFANETLWQKLWNMW
jgi:hypothetical protein